MKKMMIALGLAAAIAAGSMTVSAENYWKYNDTISIDMDETKVKTTTNGHEILHFVAVEAIDGAPVLTPMPMTARPAPFRW